LGVAAAISLAGTAMLLSADPHIVRCSLTDHLGWLSPLVVASVLGGVAIALLTQRRSSEHDDESAPTVPCTSCGRQLLGQWRMCPYCGELVPTRSVEQHSRSTT
jgi:predicted RNA-binding Zn-ribbon protein involved in translation (DUF1610 family)